VQFDHLHFSYLLSSFGGITRLVIYRCPGFPLSLNSGWSGARGGDGQYSSNMDVVLGTFLLLFSLDGFFGCMDRFTFPDAMDFLDEQVSLVTSYLSEVISFLTCFDTLHDSRTSRD
jgi:hypothetical protein